MNLLRNKTLVLLIGILLLTNLSKQTLMLFQKFAELLTHKVIFQLDVIKLHSITIKRPGVMTLGTNADQD